MTETTPMRYDADVGATLNEYLAASNRDASDYDITRHQKASDALDALLGSLCEARRLLAVEEREHNEECEQHASSLCELTEAQHALVLLANQLETHSIPFVPAAEHATAKARIDQEQARQSDEAAKRVLKKIFGERFGEPRDDHA